MADPGRSDLEAFVYQSIADPYAYRVVQGVKALKEAGERTTGSSRAEVTVTAIEGNRVSIDICVDTSDGDLLDASGKSIKAQLPVGNRIKQSANVYEYDPPYGWLLSELTTPQPYEPC